MPVPFQTPDGVLGHNSTLVLLLVMDGATTYADLIRGSTLARSTLHWHLHRLRDRGLVTWTDGKLGTIRLLVYSV